MEMSDEALPLPILQKWGQNILIMGAVLVKEAILEQESVH